MECSPGRSPGLEKENDVSPEGDGWRTWQVVNPLRFSYVLQTSLGEKDRKSTCRTSGEGVDLDRCTGCEACVVACHAENNIPTAGEDQAARGRAKHWIRVERYWEGDFPDPQASDFSPSCASSATRRRASRSVPPTPAITRRRAERAGLQPLHRHALLRERLPLQRALFQFLQSRVGQAAAPAAQSRRFRAQRRHHGKVHVLHAAHQVAEIQAEAEKREMKDGEFKPACAQSCASKAMVFGDLNDPDSEVSRLASSNRGTKLLGELGTKPNVTYLERGTWQDAKNG